VAAAAARNGDSDRAKKEVQDKLVSLQGRCRSPAALEENIVEVQAEADDLATAVQEYQRSALRPATNAAEITVQDLKDRLEAFYEYAMLRADHRDDEHLMGLVRMAQFVREPIRALIDFFNTAGSTAPDSSAN
jgi:hypothetical protein